MFKKISQKMMLLSWIVIGHASIGYSAEFTRSDFEVSLDAIRQNSLHKLSESELYQAALSGVLLHMETLNSPSNSPSHPETSEQANRLLPARVVTELKNDLEGEVSGIGAVIKFEPEKEQRYPIVTSVIAGGGAAVAGLKANDEILKIDGKPVKSFPFFRDIVYALRGKPGSSVDVSLLRDSSIVQKKVRRQKIEYAPVESEMVGKKIGKISLNYFNKKTKPALVAAVDSLQKKGASLLLLDLTRCDGGSLTEGIATLETLVAKNKVFLKMSSRSREEVYRSKNTPLAAEWPVVVTVSKETRSMCEAFAASLRIARQAIVVGETTFGKASVETLVGIGDGFSAKFTIGSLKDPNGQSWQGTGVEPDIYVAVESANAAAVTYLKR